VLLINSPMMNMGLLPVPQVVALCVAVGERVRAIELPVPRRDEGAGEPAGVAALVAAGVLAPPADAVAVLSALLVPPPHA